MQHQTKIISDQNILSMIEENNLEAWGHLYDKYSPAMFGIICNLINDRSLAEEIFKEAFLQLKGKKNLFNKAYSLYPFLLRHTNTFTHQQLKERGITSSKNLIDEPLLLNILCSEHININQLALKFNLSIEETKKKLRTEFLELRSKN